MRLAFLGAGAFGLPTVEALAAAHDVALVVSQPDRPAGRGRHPTPTPIAAFAEGAGLRIEKTDSINSPAMCNLIEAVAPDAIVVIAFGQKIGRAFLGDRFAINLHASLLPRFRGAAPINRAIQAGDSLTGLSVITIAERMDAGDILGTVSTPIDPLETAGELHDRLAAMGPALILDVLERWRLGTLVPQAQDESRVTHARKISREDAVADFSRSAREVRCLVHAMSPWPGVTVEIGNLPALRLLRVRETAAGVADARPGELLPGGRIACGDGAIELLEVQPAGGRRMTMEAFLRGHPAAAVSGDRPVARPAGLAGKARDAV